MGTGEGKQADVLATMVVVAVVSIVLVICHLLVDLDNAYSEMFRLMYCAGGPNERGGKTAAVGFSLYLPAFVSGILYSRLRRDWPIPLHRLLMAAFAVNVVIYHLNFLYPHLVRFEMWWVERVSIVGYLIGMPFNVLVMTVPFYIGAIAISEGRRGRRE